VPNQHLFDLYKQRESKILEVKLRCNNNDKMNGPFLIAPNDAYQQAALKVAFIGQETNGWSNKPDISEQMTTYSNFNLGENYKYRHGPFWSVIRKIETALTGSILFSAWLNLNRYDQGKKSPSPDNRRILSSLDFLLLEELKLIAPDVIIFFTGPRYDKRVRSLLRVEDISPMVEINGFDQRKLCQIDSPALTGKIFRTYHPKYLRLNKIEDTVIKAISDAVSKKIQSN
jgi:hypothetical protein